MLAVDARRRVQRLCTRLDDRVKDHSQYHRRCCQVVKSFRIGQGTGRERISGLEIRELHRDRDRYLQVKHGPDVIDRPAGDPALPAMVA